MKVLSVEEHAKTWMANLLSQVSLNADGSIQINKRQAILNEYYRVDSDSGRSDYYYGDNHLFSLEFEDKTLNHFSDEQMKKITMIK